MSEKGYFLLIFFPVWEGLHSYLIHTSFIPHSNELYKYTNEVRMKQD